VRARLLSSWGAGGWSPVCSQAATAMSARVRTCMVAASAIYVREAMGEAELQDSSKIRAEAYYEEHMHVRFVRSFITQFAEQEFRALQSRTEEAWEKNKKFEPARTICLVAVDGEELVGTCDVREPFIADDLEGRGAYLFNVCVKESARRRGVGMALMKASVEVAMDRFGAEQIYTHVHEDNEGAIVMYERCGFVESEERELKGFQPKIDSAPGIGMQLGSTVLLRAALPFP